MWLDVRRTHQSMKIRQLPLEQWITAKWVSLWWKKKTKKTEASNSTHCPTTTLFRAPLPAERMSHLVSMLVYPQPKLCGRSLDRDPQHESVAAWAAIFEAPSLSFVLSVSPAREPPRNNVHVGPFYASRFFWRVNANALCRGAARLTLTQDTGRRAFTDLMVHSHGTRQMVHG